MTCAITIMKIAGGTSMPIAVPAAISEAESRAVVAGLGERRHQGRAERGDLGHLRSADVGEEIGDHDHRHAEPALDPADQRAREARPARGSCRSVSIRLPAKTKAGMASSTQLCEPDTSAEDKLLHRRSRRSTGRRRRRRRARTRSASRAGSGRRRSTATSSKQHAVRSRSVLRLVLRRRRRTIIEMP